MGKSYRLKIFSIVSLFLMAFVGVYLYLELSYKKNVDRAINDRTERINYDMRLVEHEFRNISKIAYEETINTDAVAAVLNSANRADDESLVVLREALKQTLQKTYINLQGMGFEQFQFFLKDGRSFYRFHAPEHFDDSVISYRASVKSVLETGLPSKGFEIGRYFNGYRYIYPLISEGEVVGAVELSIGMDTITKIILQDDNAFVSVLYEKMKLDNVIKKDEAAMQLTPSSLFSGYYVEYIGEHSEQQIEKIDTEIKGALRSAPKTSSVYADSGYMVTFLDLFDTKDEHVGYLLVYTKDILLSELRSDFREEVILFFVIFVIGALFFIRQFIHDYHIWMSEQRFKNLFEQNRSAMILFQHKGEELYIKSINKSACKLFGIKCAELLGQKAEALFQNNDEDLIKDILDLKTKVIYSLEQNGSGKIIEIYPTEIESGGFLEIICIVFDETERLYYQEKLAESERRYKELVSFAEEGIFLSKDSRIIDMNPAGSRILGYKMNEIIGKDSFDLVDKQELEALGDMFEKSAGSCYLSVFTKDGEKVPLFVKYKTVQKDGENLRVTIIRDIREIKALEGELKRQQEFIKSIIENTPVVLFYKDKSGAYRICNRYFLEAFGLKSYDDVIGKTAETVMPKSLVANMVEIDEGIHKGLYEKKSFECALDMGGKIHHLFINKVAFVDSSGDMQGIIGTAMDITELKEMEQSLRMFNEQLSEQVEHEVSERMKFKREADAKEKLLIQQSKMAEIGNMVGAIAHQWKQPLNVVSILTQNLIDKYEYNEMSLVVMRKFSDDIGKQVRFMSQTMDDFRNFFKPSKKKSDFPLKKAADDIYNLLKAQFEKLKIEIIVEGSGDVRVYGYPNELKQVVLNLINNAKDAILESQTGNGRIVIGVTQDNDFGILEVRDNGGGIPAELLPDKLFEQYVSTKGEGGTGIGLSMSKTIVVESMGGKIEAQNTEAGAKFLLFIPLFKDTL